MTCCRGSSIAVILTQSKTLISVAARDRCLQSHYAPMVTPLLAKAAGRTKCRLWFTNLSSSKAVIHLISSAKKALKKLHDFNVMHRDLCVENLLWSTELQCVIIVDFGRSALLENHGVLPSAMHRLSSSQNRYRRVVSNVKLSSSAGVRQG